MEGIADFLDSFLGGVDLVFFSMAVGGVLWGALIIKPWKLQYDQNGLIIKGCIRLVVSGSLILAAVQFLKLAVKCWLIMKTLDRWPFPAFSDTMQFQAAIWRIVFALNLGLYGHTLLKNNLVSVKYWIGAVLLTIPFVASGAWLVHGAGRLEDREMLMVCTVLHQLGAAVWIGGIIQLLGLWILKRSNANVEEFWPKLLGRFSRLGMITVGLLLVTGITLGWNYVGAWKELVGTGYGNLLLVKIGLLAIALAFAFLNYRAVRLYSQGYQYSEVNTRTPFYIETESFVLISILFTAASLSSQPPAIDIPDLTTRWTEVVNTFRPKMPRVTSPSHEELLAGEAGRTAIIGQIPSEAATAWSDYNHNISGIFLFVTSIVGMLSYHRRFQWAEYWPFGFVALGVFLFFRSDAETWPLGPIGFWESTFGNGEVLQHRIATLLVLVLGIMELRARLTQQENSRQPYVFPILCAFGGLMLLTHSHVGFQPKTEFLIQVGHTAIGLFAIVMACGRWLELRLQPPIANFAGVVSIFAMFQISLILMFYREPLF